MIRTRDTGLLPEIEMHVRSAGGSPYDMARSNERFDPADTLEAAELVGQGPAVCDTCAAWLARPNAAVRYWAVTALAALGTEARPARAAILSAVDDDAAAVRFAVAEALSNLGDETEAFSLLAAGLQDEDPVVRLYAAVSLVAVGGRARTIESQIRAALAKEPARGTYSQYTRWALTRALAQLAD
jgi:hypothetical protein